MGQLTLISGRLQGEPTTRPTRNGGEVTFFKLKVASGNRLEFWSVATFSNTAREELAGLGEGDALSAVGELQVETYEWRGETRLNLKLTAERILALKSPPKPKKAKRAEGTGATSSTKRGCEVAAESWAALGQNDNQTVTQRFRDRILPEINEALQEGVVLGMAAPDTGGALVDDADIPF